MFCCFKWSSEEYYEINIIILSLRKLKQLCPPNYTASDGESWDLNQHESSFETHALSNISALEFGVLGSHILFISFILGCAKRVALGDTFQELGLGMDGG